MARARTSSWPFDHTTLRQILGHRPFNRAAGDIAFWIASLVIC
jgi:hypothetical protein